MLRSALILVALPPRVRRSGSRVAPLAAYPRRLGCVARDSVASQAGARMF